MGFWDFLKVRRKAKFNKLYELACQERDYDRARSLYDEAISLSQDNKNVFFKRAVLFLKEGKEPDAIKDLKQSIQIGGNFMEAQLLLGNIFYERHDYQSAFDHYDQAVKCAEDSSIAIMSRGKAWMKLNMVKDAFEDFKKAIALNPLNTSAFIERANLLMLVEKRKLQSRTWNKPSDWSLEIPEHMCFGRNYTFQKVISKKLKKTWIRPFN